VTGVDDPAIESAYDFIVCGSGSSGSVVARRLAENPDVSVLLLEAGGTDDVPAVMRPEQWPLNLDTERAWQFTAQPNRHLNGRAIPYAMGKVLGGGSSINVMMWSRGHRNDWDYFASEAGDDAWNYDSVLAIYRRIEDWQGASDLGYRGAGGPVYVQPVPDPNPVAPAALVGARSVGIPTFDHPNGRMMEGHGGASLIDIRVRDGRRQSVYRSYVFPCLDRPNLTVLTGALVTRVTFNRSHASGVEFSLDGTTRRVGAGSEVVLSLGAIHTPKVLMQSGVGDRSELQRHGIPMVQHLPGVGQNLQDHPAFGSTWESTLPLVPRNTGGEAVFFWKSDPGLDTPDLQACQLQFPFSSAENTARFGVPEFGWSWVGGVVRPESRGAVRLTGPDPRDPVEIDANLLSHPGDVTAAVACVELCREIGNSEALRPFVKREVMPGNLNGAELVRYVRDAVVTYWHQSCTAKMGRDDMSVVDGKLKVHGIDHLRVADASIMPRVTTGNTMAPSVVIGERAGEILRAEHAL
jgi:choline dehydrogenase